MRFTDVRKSWCGLQLRLIVPGQWKAAWTTELDPAEEVTSLAATVLRNIHTGEQAALELCSCNLGSSDRSVLFSDDAARGGTIFLGW